MIIEKRSRCVCFGLLLSSIYNLKLSTIKSEKILLFFPNRENEINVNILIFNPPTLTSPTSNPENNFILSMKWMNECLCVCFKIIIFFWFENSFWKQWEISFWQQLSNLIKIKTSSTMWKKVFQQTKVWIKVFPKEKQKILQTEFYQIFVEKKEKIFIFFNGKLTVEWFIRTVNVGWILEGKNLSGKKSFFWENFPKKKDSIVKSSILIFSEVIYAKLGRNNKNTKIHFISKHFLFVWQKIS